MKLVSVTALILLLQACSKSDEVQDPQQSAAASNPMYFDGSFSSREFFNKLSATGTIDTTYRYDTSWAGTLIVTTDTSTGAVSFSMPYPTIFPDRGGTSIQPSLPAQTHSEQYVFKSVERASGEFGASVSVPGSAARQISVATSASGNNIEVVDVEGDIGQRLFRTEHRFTGRLRK